MATTTRSLSFRAGANARVAIAIISKSRNAADICAITRTKRTVVANCLPLRIAKLLVASVISRPLGGDTRVAALLATHCHRTHVDVLGSCDSYP